MVLTVSPRAGEPFFLQMFIGAGMACARLAAKFFGCSWFSKILTGILKPPIKKPAHLRLQQPKNYFLLNWICG